MKKYSNYLEQFNDLIENAVPVNNMETMDTYYTEYMMENSYINEEIAELDIYQMYIIEPTFFTIEDDLKRFGAWYWKGAGVWVLNVFHYGTPWINVPPCDLDTDM